MNSQRFFSLFQRVSHNTKPTLKWRNTSKNAHSVRPGQSSNPCARFFYSVGLQNESLHPNYLKWCAVVGVALSAMLPSFEANCKAGLISADSDMALQAEEMYSNKNISRESILEFLQNAKQDFPNDIGISWRLARALYDVANLNSTANDRKKELTYEAYEIIKETIGFPSGNENYAVHKWFGIILSSVGDFEGSKVAIANSYIIRDHWMEAVKLNPTDATSHHLLGRWCVSISEISWIERKVASALFGTPPQASYQDALEHFERAEHISPGFWKKNNYMIAKCHYQLGDKTSAKEWVQKALAISISSEEDEESHAEAEALSKKL